MKLPAGHLLTNKIRVTKAASLCCSHQCKCCRTQSFIKDFSPTQRLSMPEIHKIAYFTSAYWRHHQTVQHDGHWKHGTKDLKKAFHSPTARSCSFILGIFSCLWLAQGHSETKSQNHQGWKTRLRSSSPTIHLSLIFLTKLCPPVLPEGSVPEEGTALSALLPLLFLKIIGSKRRALIKECLFAKLRNAKITAGSTSLICSIVPLNRGFRQMKRYPLYYFFFPFSFPPPFFSLFMHVSLLPCSAPGWPTNKAEQAKKPKLVLCSIRQGWPII